MEKHDNLLGAHPNLENSVEPNENRDNGKDTSLEDSTRIPTEEEEWEYITGYKLIVVIAASTMAGFLMFLDSSIVATVSTNANKSKLFARSLTSTGDSDDHQ
jgi:hypothetical protein